MFIYLLKEKWNKKLKLLIFNGKIYLQKSSLNSKIKFLIEKVQQGNTPLNLKEVSTKQVKRC